MDNNLEFFEEGLRDYVGAMMALRQFRDEVYNRSDKILRSNLGALRDAMGIDLNLTGISKHIKPENPSLSDWDGTWGWISASLKIQSWQDAQFGLYWKFEQGVTTPHVAAMFNAPNAAKREAAYGAFKRTGFGSMDHDYEGEMIMRERFEGAGHFDSILNSLIQKWVEAWKKVGGLNAIPRR